MSIVALAAWLFMQASVSAVTATGPADEPAPRMNVPVYDADLARGVAEPSLAAVQQEIARIENLLRYRAFSEARVAAEALNARIPDALVVYALLVDACVGLGDYSAAEAAAQWMLDLRPTNPAGLLRAAILRELYGDDAGAITLLEEAARYTGTGPTTEWAIIFGRLAQLHAARGQTDLAAHILREALAFSPHHPALLGAQIDVHRASGDTRAATRSARRLLAVDPQPEHRYTLAVILRDAGELTAAAKEFARFEREAYAAMARSHNANPAFVRYLVEQPGREREALRIARHESFRRQDIDTLDALAWALYHNDRYTEAHRIMNTILALGVRKAAFLRHAEIIQDAVGNAGTAEAYREAGNALAPWAHDAQPAPLAITPTQGEKR